MWYKTFLPQLHEIIAPKRYVEIGIRHGYSLSLSPEAEKTAIDPQYAQDDMQFEVKNVTFNKMTSDDFFAQYSLPNSFDLAYIDGLHLFEYALRDYINLEKYATPGSVIIVDDVIPRNAEEANREPTGGAWVGDVWKVIKCFEKYRPDLVDRMYLTGSEPTGCLVITTPDASNTALSDNYDAILAEFLAEDYPDMPDEAFRAMIVKPEASLDALRALKR